MAELKTLQNDSSVIGFLNQIEHKGRRTDSLALKQLFDESTGMKAKMWGDSIVGYGKYHYKSERSRQEGDWPLTAFSPRKQNLTVYIMPGFASYDEILAKLGKFKKSSGSCLYINKLADVDCAVLQDLIVQSVIDMKKNHNL